MPKNLVQKVRPGLKVEELADSVSLKSLRQAPYLTLLVLFGSRARGEAATLAVTGILLFYAMKKSVNSTKKENGTHFDCGGFYKELITSLTSKLMSLKSRIAQN